MKALAILRRWLTAARGAESGQAMTETALVSFFMLTGGGYVLLRFIPDMLAAITCYVHGFYLLLSYPVG